MFIIRDAQTWGQIQIPMSYRAMLWSKCVVQSSRKHYDGGDDGDCCDGYYDHHAGDDDCNDTETVTCNIFIMYYKQ